MDYLQYPYRNLRRYIVIYLCSFKPYYKWITFNTMTTIYYGIISLATMVLNLIINGLPSIL